MTRYARAAEIFAGALELPPADRPSFVVQQSNGDEMLQEDVVSLLAAHEKTPMFLETPANIEHVGLLDGGRTDGPPVTIGPYTVVGLLGEGGMGRVYLAEDTRLGRKVALKAIASRIEHDETSRERLRREARVAAALVHPGIAVVYSLDEIDGHLYIASEYIPGETLRDALERGPLPLENVLTIGRQLSSALAAAHDAGVIHRDLKPENVMRTPDGTVKILDFGLAKATGPEGPIAAAGAPAITAAGAVFGTPAYMSPEQLRGEPATAASDIFALGVVLAEISSGTHPFGGHGATTLAKVLTQEPDLSAVPDALRPVIAGCVTKVADERFRSAHEVRAALEMIARGGVVRLRDRANAFWWWQFHEAGACIFSATLIVCVWLTLGRLPYAYAFQILIAAVIGGTAATTLRLYIVFAARTRPEDPSPHRAPNAARAADMTLALAAFFSGSFQTTTHPVEAGFLMAAAVVMTVISLVVEPATARAARR